MLHRNPPFAAARQKHRFRISFSFLFFNQYNPEPSKVVELTQWREQIVGSSRDPSEFY